MCFGLGVGSVLVFLLCFGLGVACWPWRCMLALFVCVDIVDACWPCCMLAY